MTMNNELINTLSNAFNEEIQKLSELEQIVSSYGGELLFVGGAIRNTLINYFFKSEIFSNQRNELPIKDFDLVVVGLNEEIMLEITTKFSNFKKDIQGKSFGVFIYYVNNVPYEIALARKEEKIGEGHKGFSINTNNISLLEDALRRETRMNSIYMDFKYNIIDPLNGVQDIQNKIIIHNSSAFSEDPLRTLRALRHSSQFNFDISPETILEIKKCQNELTSIDSMRIYEEMKKILTADCSKGINYAIDLGVLNTLFNTNHPFNKDFLLDGSFEQNIFLLVRKIPMDELSLFFKKINDKNAKKFTDIAKRFDFYFSNFDLISIQDFLEAVKRSPFKMDDFSKILFNEKDSELLNFIFEKYYEIKANTSLPQGHLLYDLSSRRNKFLLSFL